MEDLITTKEAAEMLGIKPMSLHMRILRGAGPEPVKRGKRGVENMFKKSDVEKVLTDRINHV